MKKGVILFAHNSEKIDYGSMAIISGGLAKKHLKVPVSLITDKWTIQWLRESNKFDLAESIFENIIEIEKPHSENVRNLHDGFFSEVVPFVNSNRYSVWELTPYDKTLLIDTDYLIFSDKLNDYWNIDSSLMMAESMNDVVGDRKGILDARVSETGIHLYWATTVMFSKDQYSKFFFNLVDYVKDNYRYYADLFRFDPRQYRNDISFSVAKHIMDGFETDTKFSLPPVLTIQDKDLIQKIDENGAIKFLIDKPMDCGNFWLTSIKNQDIHLMNKQAIIRHQEDFLKLL
jgi:hypothetical protein